MSLARFFSRLTESDEERLAGEVREWASKVADTERISEVQLREKIRVAGVVRRITVWPREGDEAEYLEALVSDGTGEVNIEWTGRRSIPGLSLGTKVVLEGVLRQDKIRSMNTMTNPKFEFVT
ncbi:MAG: hypothetical protein WD004_03065 [Actinomycetota bacterium]